MVAKLVREIMVAAKLGGPDPDMNPRLAAAVEKAKKASVYKDTIERAIKKGSGQTDDKVNFELVTYEGFAPHKVPVVVECLTTAAIAPRRRFAIILRPDRSVNPAAWHFSSTISGASKPPPPTPILMPK